MCGVGGYTGLGHLSAELRYDLVEALGIGLDRRGGHAAGAVVVPEEGQPRLMRKLGTFGAARGRFIRAAANGHSVMMHTRYATTGKRDEVENAHPFAVKRKGLDGEERTVLYGCHNGMIHGAWETAKKAGREFTVDSKEFFELLADQAYETIRALSGYGVVTFIRPEDRTIRVLRLTRNSDFHAVRLVGGGVVWASTKDILKDALEYVKLEADSVLQVSEATEGVVGRVFRLSGTEAVETKLDNITLAAAQTDRRTSGGYYGSGMYDSDAWEGYMHSGVSTFRREQWSDACYVCNQFRTHEAWCSFKNMVVPSETISRNWDAYRAECDKKRAKKDAEEAERKSKASSATLSTDYVLCDDESYRRADAHGEVIPYAWPIYVKDKSHGEYVMCYNLPTANLVGGKTFGIYPKAKEYPGLGQRRMTQAEVPKASETQPSVSSRPVPTTPKHNGHWMVPSGLSPDERKEWLEMFQKSPALAAQLSAEIEELRTKTEEADLEDAAEELNQAFTESMMKGD